MSRYRRNYVNGGCYFFTVVTYKRRPVLKGGAIDILRESFAEVINQNPFKIDAIVVLPEHLHCIWQLPPGDNDYSTRWKKIKTLFTKEYKRRMDTAIAKPSKSMKKRAETGIWQRRFWEHTIRDEDDYRKHFDYIHYNPVKHGLTKNPKDWEFSSFHRYVRDGIYELGWGSGQAITFDETIGKE